MDNYEEKPPSKKIGRPEGSTNRWSKEAVRKARETGELPHEFLLRMTRGEVIMRRVVDENGEVVEQQEKYGLEDRKAAAIACAPYYAAKLSSVEVVKGIGDDDLDGIIAELAAQAGVSLGPRGEGQEDEAQASEGSRGAGDDGRPSEVRGPRRRRPEL